MSVCSSMGWIVLHSTKVGFQLGTDSIRKNNSSSSNLRFCGIEILIYGLVLLAPWSHFHITCQLEYPLSIYLLDLKKKHSWLNRNSPKCYKNVEPTWTMSPLSSFFSSFQSGELSVLQAAANISSPSFLYSLSWDGEMWQFYWDWQISRGVMRPTSMKWLQLFDCKVQFRFWALWVNLHPRAQGKFLLPHSHWREVSRSILALCSKRQLHQS